MIRWTRLCFMLIAQSVADTRFGQDHFSPGPHGERGRNQFEQIDADGVCRDDFFFRDTKLLSRCVISDSSLSRDSVINLL